MSSCKDCKCVDICYKYRDICAGRKTNNEYFDDDVTCSDFIDRTRFVELPCKVGDIIYEIKERKRNGEWKKVILERVVHGIDIGLDNFMTVRSGTTITVFLSDLGKTVFLTREEAERALNNENRIVE